MTTHLGVFAKYWEPGRVKTRLAAAVGAENAARLYREFVRVLGARLEAIGDTREITFSPDDRGAAFQACVGDGWRVRPQGAGDLGQRMQRFFQRKLASEGSRAVLIGSDSPTVPVEFVARAFQMLRQAPVVLGPSDDGGYYLVGARDEPPAIFHGVDWSTPRVWSQTVRRLERQGVAFAELPTWYDVDGNDDLDRLRKEVERCIASDPIWQPLHEQLARVFGDDT